MTEFFGPVLRIQADPDRSKACGSKEMDKEVDGGIAEKADPVTASHPDRGEGSGARIHLGASLYVGESAIGADQKLLFGSVGDPVIDELVDSFWG